MRATALSVTAALLATVLTVSGCQQSRPESLQGFGFALVDCGFDDPLDSNAATDYLDEVAAFSNLAQLCVFDPQEQVAERLQRMDDLGVQALLSVQSLFFSAEPDSSTGSGERFSLRPDFESRWHFFIEANSLDAHAETIFAFYIADEPTWNGIASDELDVVAKLVKATIPGAKTALIEAWPSIGQLVIPASIDLIGFDRYGVADPQSDEDYRADFEELKAKRTSSDQKIIVVLDSQWLPAYGEVGLDPAAMGTVAENYYAFASGDPDVVALIGYVWPSGLDDRDQLGARGLPPEVVDTYVAIGERITGK